MRPFRIAGNALGKAREAKTVWALAGQDVKGKELVAELEARIAASEKTAIKKGEWQAALDEEQKLLEETNERVSLVRQALRLKYKNQPDALAQLGLATKGRRALTAEETVDKVVRIRATRKARNTMGRRQKARADFHEPHFPEDLGGVVDLSAVA